MKAFFLGKHNGEIISEQGVASINISNDHYVVIFRDDYMDADDYCLDMDEYMFVKVEEEVI